MNLFEITVSVLLLLAVVAVTAIGITSYVKAERRRTKRLQARDADAAAVQAERVAAALAWVKRVEAASSDEAVAELPGFSRYQDSVYGPELTERLDHAYGKRRAAEDAIERRKWRTRIDKASVYERPGLFIAAREKYINLALVLDVSTEEVGRRFVADMAETLELFAHGNLLAMYEYRTVVRSKYPLDYFCDTYDVNQRPTFPEDWDDLVDAYVSEPVLSDYARANEMTVEQVRTLAGRAVRLRDPRLAKRALVLTRKERYVYGISARNGGSQSKQLVHEYQEALGGQMLFVLQMLVADPAHIDFYIGALGTLGE